MPHFAIGRDRNFVFLKCKELEISWWTLHSTHASTRMLQSLVRCHLVCLYAHTHARARQP